MITAREKCWLGKDGALVADGDENALSLVAVKGGKISEKQAARFPNVRDFFDGLPAPAPEPESGTPVPDAADPDHAPARKTRHTKSALG